MICAILRALHALLERLLAHHVAAFLVASRRSFAAFAIASAAVLASARQLLGGAKAVRADCVAFAADASSALRVATSAVDASYSLRVSRYERDPRRDPPVSTPWAASSSASACEPSRRRRHAAVRTSSCADALFDHLLLHVLLSLVGLRLRGGERSAAR